MDTLITRSNLKTVLSKYPDLSSEQKQEIQIQLKQAAVKDSGFWKAVVDYLKEDPMLDTSNHTAIFIAICTTGDMTEITDRYYSY